mmetsp:Transcript_35378/g.85621  ORF Transcript_35378/g.85621 Transcript_35378/m.85621 type:complete len:300 (-) Transcript_35378:1325-2224(-)
MVFFTCDGCNETLKKNQVDTHVYKCRQGCESVSCVDCSISFYGDDFRQHTTCTMTEVGNLVADRTGGSKSKKKQSPQEAWMDLLESSVESAPNSVQSHLRRMVTTLDNIPRKEKQFRNFAMNSLNLGRGSQATQVVDAIWKHLSQQREKQKQEREAAAAAAEASKSTKKEEKQAPKQTTNGQSTDKEETKSTPKATISSDDSESDAKGSTNNMKSTSESKKKSNSKKSNYKSVKKATKKILKKAPGKSMKLKRLQKQLMEMKCAGDDCSEEELAGLLEKVVSKESKKFQLDGKEIKIIV